MDSKIRSAAKLLQIKTRTGAETCTGYGVVIVLRITCSDPQPLAVYRRAHFAIVRMFGINKVRAGAETCPDSVWRIWSLISLD